MMKSTDSRRPSRSARHLFAVIIAGLLILLAPASSAQGVALQEDFADGEITSNPVWSVYNNAFAVVDGVLHSDGQIFDQSDRYQVYYTTSVAMPESDFIEFSFLGSLKSAGNPQAGRGIMLVLGSGSSDKGYYINIQRGNTNGFSTNKYSLSLTYGSGGVLADLIVTSYEPNYDQAYEVKAIRLDGSWSLYVDGALIGMTQDPPGTFAQIEVVQILSVGSTTIDDVFVSVSPPAAPEMEARGNDLPIADGDTTPSTADHTDFGSTAAAGGTITRSFTIVNWGHADLNLMGEPKAVVEGPHASDFAVDSQPASPVTGPGGSTTFAITFDPGGEGLRTATVSIDNDDASENPYTFAIQGTGAGSGSISGRVSLPETGEGATSGWVCPVEGGLWTPIRRML